MALVADSFEPAGRPASSVGALPLSLALHGLLLIGALWLFNHPAPQETPDLESVSVSIITMETAANVEPTPERSDASQTLLAAGSTTPVTPTPIEAVDKPAAVPVETETQPTPVEMAVAPRTDFAASAAADVADAVPAERSEPAVAAPTSEPPVAPAEAAAATALAPVEQLGVASAERAAFAEPVSAAPAETPRTEAASATEAVPVDAAAAPQTAIVDPVTDAAQKPAPSAAKPVRVADAAKPKPTEEPKPAPTGSGGRSDANAQAAAAAPSGAGRVALGGSAADSRYPGLVQARLRRALRFPPNAGAASGQALVRFLVAADGSVSGISVVGSTGSSILDAAALDTVRRAAPFPPIPSTAGRSNWSFTLPLRFRR